MDYKKLKELKKHKGFSVSKYWGEGNYGDGKERKDFALSAIAEAEFVGAYAMLDFLKDKSLVSFFEVNEDGTWDTTARMDVAIPETVEGELVDYELALRIDVGGLVRDITDGLDSGMPQYLVPGEEFAKKLREYADEILDAAKAFKARTAEKPE